MFNPLQVGIIVPVSFNKFKINSFLLTRVSALSIVKKKKKTSTSIHKIIIVEKKEYVE